jgi:8-oxo-dGTP diphosphatase
MLRRPRVYMTAREHKQAMQPLVRISAGGVVARNGADGVEVVLILTQPRGRWQLPKGMLEENETPEDAAVREVQEETGLKVSIVERLGTIAYRFRPTCTSGNRVLVHKTVHFYLMTCSGGNLSDHDHEVYEARWLSLRKASRLLAFQNERLLVEKAGYLLDARPSRNESETDDI